jgi:hypothetical protein
VEVGAGTAFVTTGVSVCIGSAAALGKVPEEGVESLLCNITWTAAVCRLFRGI